jgi:hypothetical protein
MAGGKRVGENKMSSQWNLTSAAMEVWLHEKSPASTNIEKGVAPCQVG